MPEKRDGESGVLSDAAECLVDDLLGLSDGVGAEVGEYSTLEVAPDLFDRIGVGGIAQKPLYHQPSSLVLEEGLQSDAPVRRESVPDQGDLVASPSPSRWRWRSERNSMIDTSLYEPGRMPKTGDASLPSGRKQIAAHIDRRFQLKWCVRTASYPWAPRSISGHAPIIPRNAGLSGYYANLFRCGFYATPEKQRPTS